MPKEVKVDITIREEVAFPLESRRVLRAYQEYQDLPEDAEVLAYSLREIAAEKVIALLDGARNEPRDLYDIWFLASDGHVDLGDLTHALEKKWEFRGKKPADARQALDSKEAHPISGDMVRAKPRMPTDQDDLHPGHIKVWKNQSF